MFGCLERCSEINGHISERNRKFSFTLCAFGSRMLLSNFSNKKILAQKRWHHIRQQNPPKLPNQRAGLCRHQCRRACVCVINHLVCRVATCHSFIQRGGGSRLIWQQRRCTAFTRERRERPRFVVLLLFRLILYGQTCFLR